MDTITSIDLVHQWKQPGERQGASAGHPAGEIRLRTTSRLARRSALLAGSAGDAARADTGFPTMTIEER
ncbi:hypothetical protein [Kitasatospora sp. MAP5-34]|uniref:hypothetical protein n=1 Tax=Kitasatospora sp. MAP5-34 TaxID=3035102 RepID=UPI002473D470|nr:hypothetical protein [Kitasatospora sp. MAP5-34]MDH6579912.1 hypothetical protein [Kitasatospora sp. MAP5-34]